MAWGSNHSFPCMRRGVPLDVTSVRVAAIAVSVCDGPDARRSRESDDGAEARGEHDARSANSPYIRRAGLVSSTPAASAADSGADPPLVVLSGAGVRFGSTQILRDVNLEVGAGEVVGLFGANGAGKTTALRLIATLIRPAQGMGIVLGADLASSDRYDVRRRIGMVGHVPGLFPELTLAENLQYAGRVAGVPIDRVQEALAAVGLAGAADRLAGASSHGMQRRTEFARELMIDRSLLLLDEPHSALDRNAVDLVEGLIERKAAEGGAVIVVSHDRDRINAIAHRSVELAGGTLT
jgi:heme exporter protein A